MRISAPRTRRSSLVAMSCQVVGGRWAMRVSASSGPSTDSSLRCRLSRVRSSTAMWVSSLIGVRGGVGRSDRTKGVGHGPRRGHLAPSRPGGARDPGHHQPTTLCRATPRGRVRQAACWSWGSSADAVGGGSVSVADVGPVAAGGRIDQPPEQQVGEDRDAAEQDRDDEANADQQRIEVEVAGEA